MRFACEECGNPHRLDIVVRMPGRRTGGDQPALREQACRGSVALPRVAVTSLRSWYGSDDGKYAR